MLLINNGSPIIASDKPLKVTPELYLPKPYFWLKPGENVLLDSVLGVRRWVDSVNSLFFTNHYNKNIPFENSGYGLYPIFDKPHTETALRSWFLQSLNTQDFTVILISKFINKVLTGSSSQYSTPVWNRVAKLQPDGKYYFSGWNIYCINTGIGKSDFRWEFWTGAGSQFTGWNVARGSLVVPNNWMILACRRGYGKTSIFENGIKMNEINVNYINNLDGAFYLMGNANQDYIYFNYALSDGEIFHWSHYLKLLYAGLFTQFS